MYKLIIWGTGLVGKAVIRGLLDHPNFDIVAVIVNDPAKEGKDIGALVGAGDVGIVATRDSAAALAMDADAVAYFGPSAIHADINMANITAALRAGKNVLDTTMGVFENPSRAPAELVEQIESACRAGNSSFFSGGIDPGFANDLFPITLAGLCARVDTIRTIEFIDAGTYPDQDSMIALGLTSREDDECVLDMPGMMTAVWGGPLYMIAEALGVEIESTNEVYDRWFATEAREFAMGRVEVGQCAAHRVQLQGVVAGEPRIFVDHYHRLYPEAAPDWARPQSNPVHANRIEIEGQPRIVQETVLEDPISGDGNAGTCLATGMRAVNAIEAVCSAEPGILSTLGLPLIGGRGAMR